jgi:hypothetical protein
MAWLEDALSQSWSSVRPQDLACLAFNAVKPEWPHRAVAVSHRSMDVKPALEQTLAWKSSRFAIDANYVPAWETNTGMIWGLLATTPVLTRILSPHYPESEWCVRESELIEHLAKRCDFLNSRVVVDLPRERLSDLDKIVLAWREREPESRDTSLLEFPPQCSVYKPAFPAEWELVLTRSDGRFS